LGGKGERKKTGKGFSVGARREKKKELKGSGKINLMGGGNQGEEDGGRTKRKREGTIYRKEKKQREVIKNKYCGRDGRTT